MKLVLAEDLGFAILLGPLLTESDTRQSHQTFKGGSLKSFFEPGFFLILVLIFAYDKKGITTKICGLKVELKFRPLNPNIKLWLI
jgi:hypothetical protein